MTKLKNLNWIQDHLPEDVIAQPMHDGVGFYWREKLVLILIESSLTPIYRGVHYPFQIWNGCFFPVEKIKQNAVIKKFLFLENHPALPNCLYIPAEDENFEELTQQVIREVFRGNPLFGEFIKIKKPTKKKTSAVAQVSTTKSKPTLFLNDEVPTNRAPIKKSGEIKSKRKLGNKTAKKAENKFLLSKIK